MALTRFYGYDSYTLRSLEMLEVHVAALAIKPRLRRMGLCCLFRLWDEFITDQLNDNKDRIPFI